MAKSYQFGVYGGGCGNTIDNPSTNSCHFATEQEAIRAGNELLSRWFMPSGFKVLESDSEPNYEFPDDCSQPRPIAKGEAK